MILRRTVTVAAFLALISTSGLCLDASMGRYSADQRSYTTEKLQLPVALSWEFKGEKFNRNQASPVVVGNRCYFATGNRVYAVDLETGKQLWMYPSGQALGSPVKSTPAVANGFIYFGTADGNLYCVDVETGQFQWAYQTRGAIRCPPVVSDGIVYIGTDDNSVYAISAETGDLAWRKPYTVKDDIANGIAVSLGIVIASSMDGNIYGINASTGKLRWVYQLATTPAHTSPIISDSTAVMALGDSVYGFTARSGQLKWLITLPAEIAGTPASDGTSIYIPCKDKKIHAYSLSGRKPTKKWSTPADFGAIPTSSPTIADDTVYVTGQRGVIAAFSAVDGSLKWRYMIAPSAESTSLYTDAFSSPTIANGTLTVLTDDGMLHCFSSTTPDAEAPDVYMRKPQSGYATAANPPLKFSSVVYDSGSGVDFSTVSLSLDGQTLDYTVDNATSTITAIYGKKEDGKEIQVKALSENIHTIKLTGKDYAGNLLQDEWYFYADPKLNPPKSAVTGKKTLTNPNPGKTSGIQNNNTGGNNRNNSRGNRSGRGNFGSSDGPPMPPMPPTRGGGQGGMQPPPPQMEPPVDNM